MSPEEKKRPDFSITSWKSMLFLLCICLIFTMIAVQIADALGDRYPFLKKTLLIKTETVDQAPSQDSLIITLQKELEAQKLSSAERELELVKERNELLKTIQYYQRELIKELAIRKNSVQQTKIATDGR